MDEAMSIFERRFNQLNLEESQLFNYKINAAFLKKYPPKGKITFEEIEAYFDACNEFEARKMKTMFNDITKTREIH